MHQETTNEEVSNAFGKLKIALNINSSFKENNNHTSIMLWKSQFWT